MTSTTDAPVEVMQADREAAATLAGNLWDDRNAEHFRQGKADGHYITEAFARHRIAHAPATERTDDGLVEAVARGIAQSDGLDYDEVCGMDTEAEECDSGSCIAACCEDHEPDWARQVYRSRAQAALRVARPVIEAAERERAAMIVESGMFNEYGRPQPELVKAIRNRENDRG